MKKEFIVERQGRAFVLYAGLLNMAHENGLKSIQTELVQIPSEANKHVAICTATVVLEKEGVERTYTGIGDAAPNNVAPAMQTCLIRMAETRSKARALRDAVNVGVAAFEELGEDDAHDGAPERGYALPTSRSSRTERSAPAHRSPQGNGAVARTTPGKPPALVTTTTESPIPNRGQITEAQAKAIRSLCRAKGLEADTQAQERFDVKSLEKLTETQAGELIRALSERVSNRVPIAS